jgi:GR25 family glycosyltransferase involved in LPS biosynthesis
MSINTKIIDIVENWDLPYTLGNSIYHIFNSKDENENEIEELKKAHYFLKNRIGSLENSKPNILTDKIKINNINFKCINLESRQDRRDWIDSHLPQFGIKYNYVNASVYSEDYKNLIFPKEYVDGAKGCFISHYELIKNYKGNKILGIFEDDVELCNDFLDRIKYIENNFNLDWDIFFLSSFYHLNSDKKRWHKTGDFEFTDIKYIHKVYGSFCTHAYLINPKSINKITSLMESTLDKSYAIDHLYILIQPHLNCYSFTPGLANQMISKSDIDNRVKNQNEFETIVGKHFFSNNLEDFNYEEYFKK